MNKVMSNVDRLTENLKNITFINKIPLKLVG
jgi:hypothetical protein